jgi:hypothetical protein
VYAVEDNHIGELFAVARFFFQPVLGRSLTKKTASAARGADRRAADLAT